jgi:predicted Zn-dependent protease
MQYAAKDAATLQRAHRQLLEAEGSFRPMTAEDHNQARPWVVKTIPFPRGGFAEMARQSPLPSAEQQLRLINGVYGGGEPKPGQLVKTIVRL